MQVVLDIDQAVILQALGPKRGAQMVAAVARKYLEASAIHNRVVMRCARLLGNPLPSILDPASGVRYRPENNPPGVEEFASVRRVLERGWGDCDDFGPIRSAELSEAGERNGIRVHWRFNPTGTDFHITNRRENGDIEDASRLLGM